MLVQNSGGERREFHDATMYTYIRPHMYVCIYIYIYMYVCMYVCVYIYIYIYQVSYVIPVLLRNTFARHTWQPGVWNLGRLGFPIAVISSIWQITSCIPFFWPFVYPVDPVNMNYTVVVIAGVMFQAYVYWFFVARYTYRGTSGSAHAS